MEKIYSKNSRDKILPLADCCPGSNSSWWGLCCGEDTCEEPNNTFLSAQQFRHFGKNDDDKQALNNDISTVYPINQSAEYN